MSRLSVLIFWLQAHKRFILLLIGIISIILVLGVSGLFLYKKFVLQTPSTQKKQTLPTSSKNEKRYQLFYVDLSYDTKTKAVTAVRQSYEKDILPVYTAIKPTDPSVFPFQVEIIQADGKILHRGWGSVNKKISQTSTGAILFRVTSVYEKGAIVKVFIMGNTPAYQTTIP